MIIKVDFPQPSTPLPSQPSTNESSMFSLLGDDYWPGAPTAWDDPDPPCVDTSCGDYRITERRSSGRHRHRHRYSHRGHSHSHSHRGRKTLTQLLREKKKWRRERSRRKIGRKKSTGK